MYKQKLKTIDEIIEGMIFDGLEKRVSLEKMNLVYRFSDVFDLDDWLKSHKDISVCNHVIKRTPISKICELDNVSPNEIIKIVRSHLLEFYGYTLRDLSPIPEMIRAEYIEYLQSGELLKYTSSERDSDIHKKSSLYISFNLDYLTVLKILMPLNRSYSDTYIRKGITELPFKECYEICKRYNDEGDSWDESEICSEYHISAKVVKSLKEKYTKIILNYKSVETDREHGMSIKNLAEKYESTPHCIETLLLFLGVD